MKFLKNEEIDSIKEFIRKENVKLLQKYFLVKTTNEKIEIAKQVRENLDYLYTNRKVIGGRR